MAIDVVTAQDVQRLQQALAFVDLTAGSAASEYQRLLLARLNHIKVQMYREQGPHKRPHFHIEFKREYRATYAIDTLERIIGYMPKRYEAPAIEWARSCKAQLANCWDRIVAGGEPLKIELEGSPASS
jgi:Domain of unknown function (DUF4160)